LPRTRIDRQSTDNDAFVFWRDGVISRQSNPNRDSIDPTLGQVLPGVTYVDTVDFVASVDIPRATIRVQQPNFGTKTSPAYHVTVSALGMPASTELLIDPEFPDEPAIPAGIPISVTITSRVPPESQATAPTPRTLTSVVRVVQRVGEGRAVRNLNKALIVRTELQAAIWATKNGRATPTPISQ
jgi:hypothetical protein